MVESYDPVVVATALALYAYNIDVDERAEEVCENPKDIPFVKKKLLLDTIPLGLRYNVFVKYVMKALERYGDEAAERCEANSGL